MILPYCFDVQTIDFRVVITRNNVETLSLRARVPTDYFSFSQTSTRVSITL